MTASFLDVWIVNAETISFLLSVRPDLPYKIACAGALILAVLVVLWRIDTRHVRLRSAAAGLMACLAGLTGVSLALPQDGWAAWFGDSYVSKFSRSGVSAISGLLTEGYLESAATVTERLKTLPDATCAPSHAPPHIILVHDEFELRYPRRARRQGPGRLRWTLPLLRRQGAPLHYRGRRRSELVYRVQCPCRTIRAFLRPLRLLRHADRRRASRAWSAGGIAPLRLSNLFDLSRARRVHERKELSNQHRRAEIR